MAWLCAGSTFPAQQHPIGHCPGSIQFRFREQAEEYQRYSRFSLTDLHEIIRAQEQRQAIRITRPNGMAESPSDSRNKTDHV